MLHILPISPSFFIFLNHAINVWWSIDYEAPDNLIFSTGLLCLLPWDENAFVVNGVHIGLGQIHYCDCSNSSHCPI